MQPGTTDKVTTVHTSAAHASKGSSSELHFTSLYRVYYHILEPNERRALWLVEVEGRSYDEIAEIMACARADVKQAVFLARRKLFWGMGRTLEELEKQPVH